MVTRDYRSWILYALDKTNVIVTTLTGCMVLYTRSTGVAYFAAGAVCCSLLVKLAKRFIRQPRPIHIEGRQKKSYGMPSTHSAVISYYAAYVVLACAYLPIHPSLPVSPVSRILPLFIVPPLSSVIAVSRIWLGHHTWPQVATGCIFGMLYAPLWFFLWTKGGNEYGRNLEQLITSIH